MSKPEFIYRVQFFNRPAGSYTEQREFFFGSLAAIYELFTPEQIGCKVDNLWNIHVSDGVPYVNSLCRITRETLIRKERENKPRKRKSSGQ